MDNTSKDLISIIIPTIGRTIQLDALLCSISESAYKNYEIIIVDQNLTGLADEVIAKHKSVLPITHVKACFTGAARARNHGLPFAKGKYIFFPDDDSKLFPENLSHFLQTLKSRNADVVFGKIIGSDPTDYTKDFLTESGYLTLTRHEKMFIEATMFIKREIFANFQFDETFGIGTFYGAEEGHDLVLRMLREDVVIYYTPEIRVFHPRKVISYDDTAERRRVFSYRCGFGHLCSKHKLYKKYFSRLMKVLLYIPFTLVFAPQKTRYYLSELMGLLTGIVVR